MLLSVRLRQRSRRIGVDTKRSFKIPTRPITWRACVKLPLRSRDIHRDQRGPALGQPGADRFQNGEAVVGGKTIRDGEGVILPTDSANRDEAAFNEPDRLDIAHKGPKHTAFGHGVHHCIGAELARMETSAVIATPPRESSGIRLRSDPTGYRHSTVVRGLESLTVRIERPPRPARA